MPRDEIGKPESGVTVKKLFVGGIKDDVDEDVSVSWYFRDCMFHLIIVKKYSLAF